MTRLLSGAVLVAALAAALPVWAEGPMTPLHSSAPGASKPQFVEPPPTVEPEAPKPTADTAGSPAASATESEPQTARRHRPESRPAYRRTAGARRGSSAQQLNRAELRRIGSGIPSYPVYSAYPSYASPSFGPRVYSEGY